MANTLLEMKSCLHGKYTASNEVTFASNTHLETKSHQVKWQSHTSYGRSKSCDNYTGKNSHAIPHVLVTPAMAEAETVRPSHLYCQSTCHTSCGWRQSHTSLHVAWRTHCVVFCRLSRRLLPGSSSFSPPFGDQSYILNKKSTLIFIP